MRDLLLTLFILGMLPVSFLRPQLGLYMWAWISYMNPHRLTWSYAYSFRFNFFIAFVTILGIIASWKKTAKIPRNFTVYMMFMFFAWTTVTSYSAFSPRAWDEWEQFLKIYMMVVATFMLADTRKVILVLISIITLSIGFFGIKGGIFTILTGGRFHILGPTQSFFADNNTFALAEIMVIPMFLFLRGMLVNRWLRMLFLLFAGLAMLSVLGSYSRGGLVGLVVIMGYFLLQSRGKIKIIIMLVLAVMLALSLMPQKWQKRMRSLVDSVVVPISVTEIVTKKSPFDPTNDPFPAEAQKVEKSSEELLDEKSIQGRFDAWNFVWILVQDRPFVGGGFRTFLQKAYDIYTPGVYRRDAHSIYFEVLGEHGFVGFGCWILMHISAFRIRRSIMSSTKHDVDLFWAHELARFLGISLMGYYASGAFLGLAYFDLPYHYISLMVVLGVVVRNQQTEHYQPVKQTGRFPYKTRDSAV